MDGELTREDIERLKSYGDVEGLIESLQHLDPELNELAVLALEELGDDRAIGPILDFIERTDRTHLIVEGAALMRLRKRGDVTTLAILSGWLSGSDVKLRRKAASALRSMTFYKDSDILFLLLAALKDPDDLVRTYATKGILNQYDRKAIPDLVSALSDPCKEVRGYAATAIMLIFKEEDADPVMSALAGLDDEKLASVSFLFKKIAPVKGNVCVLPHLNNGNDFIRTSAVEALGYPGDFGATERLAAALGDPSAEVRAAAARSLGRIPALSAIDRLHGALNDADKHVQREAIEALGKCRDDRSSDHLKNFIGNPDRSRRIAAIYALSAIGTRNAITHIIAALECHDGFELNHTIKALENAVDARLVEPLARVVEDESIRFDYGLDLDNFHCQDYDYDIYTDIKLPAMDLMIRIGHPSAMASFIRLLKHPQANIRSKAILGLKALADLHSLQPLVEALNDRDDGIRLEAFNVISEFPRDEATPIVLDCLDNTSAKVRIAAIDYLARHRIAAAARHLIGSLRDPSIGVRWHAARALGGMKYEAATGPLLKMLRSPDGDARPVAALALGAMGDPRAIDALIRASKDDDDTLRLFSIDALGEIGGDRAAIALARMLYTRSDLEAWRIIAALIKANSGLTQERMLRLLNSRNVEARRYAALVLGEIGAEISLGHLERTLEDKDEKVRIAASRAIERIRDRIDWPLDGLY